MADKVATVCATCHRAIWESDLDASGNCVDCAKPETVSKVKDKK